MTIHATPTARAAIRHESAPMPLRRQPMPSRGCWLFRLRDTARLCITPSYEIRRAHAHDLFTYRQIADVEPSRFAYLIFGC